MTAFAQGNEGAFVELYDRYKIRIFNLARRLLAGDRARAEEAAQDVFLKLYGAKKSYQPTARFSTFLYRIAINHCLNSRARKSERMTSVDPDLDQRTQSEGASAERLLERSDLRESLRVALAKLPDAQRAALVLCHYEGASYREAADMLDVTEAAVKSLVHRARTRLTTDLAQWMPATEARSST
ncbi:MAG: RNA polymerase sigma factor [Myxococcota bacterium]|nr:RNA polymerase sigma factor [Myxococcota bacterium]